MKKVVVILVGIVLLAGVIFTGTYGVSQKNIEVISQQGEMLHSEPFYYLHDLSNGSQQQAV